MRLLHRIKYELSRLSPKYTPFSPSVVRFSISIPGEIARRFSIVVQVDRIIEYRLSLWKCSQIFRTISILVTMEWNKTWNKKTHFCNSIKKKTKNLSDLSTVFSSIRYILRPLNKIFNKKYSNPLKTVHQL